VKCFGWLIFARQCGILLGNCSYGSEVAAILPRFVGAVSKRKTD
jgi:hypothetical protein